MTDSIIEVSIKQHVAHVQFCRADKMNALNKDMITALIDTAQQIKQDRSVRAVVISGRGGNFCAGLDKSNFSSVMQGQGLQIGDDPNVTALRQRTHGIYNIVQKIVWQWREIPVPVIAAIEGVALGGGLQIALAADMRYAASNSKFSILEIKWGLIPDMGSTQLMRHLISEDTVRDLTYTGRIFSAHEANEYGFVTGVNENPVEHSLLKAREISQQNPDAIRASKALLNAAPYLSVEEGLLMESHLQDEIIGSDNQKEAIMSVLEKRTAQFKD